MKGFLKHIAIIDKYDTTHSVEFTTGVNVVTGRSSTGKSALIEIFDYCFGSSEFTVPVGLITDNAEIYYIVLKLEETHLILARKNSDRGRAFIKEYPDFTSIDNITLDYFQSTYFILIKDFRLELGRHFRLTIDNVDEDIIEGIRKKPRPSVRNYMSYMLQHQNLIANKHSIFYRFDQKEKREQTIDQFKIIAGFVSPEYFTKKQELNRLERELKVFEKQKALENINAEKIKHDIQSLKNEYKAITGTNLISDTPELIIANPQRIIDLISTINVNVDDDSRVFITEIDNLEKLRDDLRAEKRDKLIQLNNFTASIEYVETYKTNIEGTPIINQADTYVSQCPFCHSSDDKIIMEANKLHEAINWLNSELKKTPYMIDSFTHNREKLSVEIKLIDVEVATLKKRIDSLLKVSEKLRLHKSLEEQGLKVKLKLEAILDIVLLNATSETSKLIKEKIKEINVLKGYISTNYNVDKKLALAQKEINNYMNEIGSTFAFEASYTPINLHFDLSTFELFHTKEDGDKVYLRSMGSGANWLYCHLSLFLALNRYFCSLKEECLMPPILFFDQPTQVYFPDSIKDNDVKFKPDLLKEKENGSTDKSYQNDLQAVENFFDQIVKFSIETEVNTKVSPQIIIIDHADNLELNHAEFDDIVNGRRWRSENEGLIKLDKLKLDKTNQA